MAGILLVDDNTDGRRSLRSFLQNKTLSPFVE